jgi:hypothetical protein
LFLVFVWGVFFTKRHFWKLVIAVVIGAGFGFVKKKLETPVFNSTIVIKQNYNTGEHLYNSIDYYNSLIKEKDSITLSNLLRVEQKTASQLVEIELESVLTENQRFQLYDEYKKGLDSVLALKVSYKNFVKNDKEYDAKLQRITISSKGKENFSTMFNSLINNIVKIDYFKNEQEKDLEEFSKREKVIAESLKKADSLREIYEEVLAKSVEKSAAGETNITFEGSSNQAITKEFELHNNDLVLNRELVEINRKKANIKDIIEVVSRQQDSGTKVNTTKLFGIETSPMIVYSAVLFLVVFVTLLGLEIVKFLERFKDEVS